MTAQILFAHRIGQLGYYLRPSENDSQCFYIYKPDYSCLLKVVFAETGWQVDDIGGNATSLQFQLEMEARQLCH